jgi:hypothetical protein
MEETNESNFLPQQEKIQGKEKEKVKDDIIKFQIEHCHFHLSQFELEVLHLMVTTIVKGVITSAGTFKQDLHAKGKGIKSTLKY